MIAKKQAQIFLQETENDHKKRNREVIVALNESINHHKESLIAHARQFEIKIKNKKKKKSKTRNKRKRNRIKKKKKMK